MAMTWTTFHRRGAVLRTVTEALDARRDGLLPMDLPGVTETFGDELTLLGALQLRWHTRLSGHLERALMRQRVETEQAAIEAWLAAAAELPGTRLVLDHYRAEPLDVPMGVALAAAAEKERVLLAAMAGRNAGTTRATAAEGAALESRARERHDLAPAQTSRPHAVA
jgi:hypothetical protein